jgi:hypothetical protein
VVGLTSSAVNLHMALLHLGCKGQDIVTKVLAILLFFFMLIYVVWIYPFDS